MKNIFRFFSLGILAFAFYACAPKVIVNPDFEKSISHSIAFLPIDYPSDIPRERVDYIKSALSSELKNNGFVILDDRIVAKICSSPECPEKSSLSSKYLADSFVKLDVSSIVRANFLAGYVNTIKGNLRFYDKQGKEILSVENIESEKGGLLFNTGQIFQGLKSQVENEGDSSFNRLADKFAKTLVSKVPASTSNVSPPGEEVAVHVTSVKATAIAPSVYQVCVNATPNSMASLLINRQKSNLREVANGKYCGNFGLGGLFLASNLAVEVRSPFGNADRKDLSLNMGSPCKIDGKVKLKEDSDSKKLLIVCTKLGGASSIIGDCEEKEISECSEDSKFLVYKSQNESGPYQRVAEVRKTSWEERSKGSTYYEVVAKNAHGVRTLPVTAKLVTTK